MCGIAGIFMKNGRPAPDPVLIRKMTDVLLHRGPDESGCHIDGSVALGHRRLSIIDLGTGQQPMFNEDRSLAIVFNGEIYNFEDLRDELEKKGHGFRTHSDTETILHAYEEWGDECLGRLRGMFAFAIWDGRLNELFLARDRVGKKPIYYLDSPEYFLFGSELKALLEFPGIEREIDLEAFSDYLTFLYVPSPKCIFRNFRKLSPAHYLKVSSGRLTTKRYWDLSFREDRDRSFEEWREELSETLHDAVRCRLKSEVPLGAFLSGGLDSSIVVAMMARIMSRPVETMSIGFAEEEYDEIPFAREVADLYRTDHHEFVVKALEGDVFEKLGWMFDEPFADSSAIPTYHVSRIARQHVTVALSGDGGDESFAGYRRYYFDVLENRIRGLIPAALRRILFGGLGYLYPKGDWLPQPLRGKTMLTNLSLSPEKGYFRTRSAFHPEMKSKLLKEDVLRKLGGYDSFTVLERYFDRCKGWDPLSRIQYVDVMTYLPDDILVKVDRASMANSLEVRAPLLDTKVMELAAKIPSRLKLHGSSNKYILKSASGTLLPGGVINRKKMGFSVPLGSWVRSGFLAEYVGSLLESGHGIGEYMDRDYVSRLMSSHRTGTGNFGTHLWAIAVFESWYRAYIH